MSSNKGGFVLFEVLVSAAILSAGCLMLVEALQGSIRSTRRLQDTYEATLNAGNVLWMVDRAHDPVPIENFTTAGSLRDFRASVQPQPLTALPFSDALDALSVTVQWTPAGPGTTPESLVMASYYPHENSSKP